VFVACAILPHRLAKVMADPARHRVQIIYTQIDRAKDNRPHFRSFAYRVDPGEYFYPASTVKLPVALLSLEKINRLDVPGLDRHTAMLSSPRPVPRSRKQPSHQPCTLPQRRRNGLRTAGRLQSAIRFVYREMSKYPYESGISEYEDSDEYPQALYDRDDIIPENIRIFNKMYPTCAALC
jgi:hypothetical protein